MRIEVENLTPQGEPFAQVYGEGDLLLEEEDARLAGEAAVEGHASRKGEEVRLRGRIRATVEAACDRCLRPVLLPIELEFSESYARVAPRAGPGEERELQPADLHLSVYEGDEIDVDDLAREQILLALPAQVFCREDCKGLCDKCRADLNAGECDCPKGEIDPRWAALANLKSVTSDE